ncbi:hypothetical protein MIND_01099100 [Mycena indigotica]|uniref:Uncharacterized protein n=1 Tax=Mycena indigotica TaxID=2126181 RepID=A0A8H6VXK2_9AGAR|nr:uncharacterized protein MIND_01099100 [Mycena indigotica]KAF7295591.1 hypothetical protein MIND_01099100 [Mycena indigotica]
MSTSRRVQNKHRPILGKSLSAPVPRTARSKRPISTQTQNSDDPSDFTSLSDSAQSLRRVTSPFDASEGCVFILLSLDGNVVPLDEGGEKIWWPAQRVPSSSGQYKIYGQFGVASPEAVIMLVGNTQVVTATKPNGEIRFPHPQYVNAGGARKRQKLDKTVLEEAWMKAVAYLIRDMDDSLPSPEFITSVRHIPKLPDPTGQPAKQKQTKGISISDDELSELSETEDEPWIPPPPDWTLTIPGELILGKERKLDRQFWYAKVLEYVPPPAPDKKPLYKVLWIDSQEGLIERDWFFACEEDGFGTCTVGKFESQIVEDVADEEDSNDEDLLEQLLRDISPEPDPGPLPDGLTFSDLDIRDQFVHTKPVLRAILQDKYPPAKTAHDMFIAGGKKREAVVKQAGEHGMMNPKDVTLLRRFLEEWVLRGLVRRRGDDENEEQSEALRTPALTRSPSPPATVAGDVDQPLSPASIPPSSSMVSVDVYLPSIVPPSSLDEDDNHITSAARGNSFASESSGTVAFPPLSFQLKTEQIDIEPPSSPPKPTISSTCFRDGSIDMELELSHVRTKLEGGDDISSPPLSTQLSATASSKSPRQIGCAAYEALSPFEKYDYCLNVLLPELLIQIYAWRAGKRPALELLDEATESEVHEFGAGEKGEAGLGV